MDRRIAVLFSIVVLIPVAVIQPSRAGTGGIFPASGPSTGSPSTSVPTLQTPTGSSTLPSFQSTPSLSNPGVVAPASGSPASNGLVPQQGQTESGQGQNPFNQSLQNSGQNAAPLLRGINGTPANATPAMGSNKNASATKSGSNQDNTTGGARANGIMTGLNASNANGSNFVPLKGAAVTSGDQSSGSVQSFFQIHSAQPPSLPNSKGSASASAQADQRQHRKTSRFFWHLLDNAGVPMFLGKKDDDLDPSLRNGYIDTSSGKDNNSDSRSTQSNEPQQHAPKFPASELEGLDNDSPTKTP